MECAEYGQEVEAVGGALLAVETPAQFVEPGPSTAGVLCVGEVHGGHAEQPVGVNELVEFGCGPRASMTGHVVTPQPRVRNQGIYERISMDNHC